MKYKVFKNKIEVYDKKDFIPKHIFECGQVFRFLKYDDHWMIISTDKCATIVEKNNKVIINTKHVDYFLKYFDFGTDYTRIKTQIQRYDWLKPIINCSGGIRILKQDIFETIISFIISANNNIKRIKNILNTLALQCGTDCGDYYAFPTFEQLLNKSEDYFRSIGAGYRAKYLVKFIKQFQDFTKIRFKELTAKELKDELIKLSGVGPKVANCILLFAFGKTDVFPVDTWIEKAYYQFFDNKKRTRNQISSYLETKFGSLAGYVQQYLFYYKTIQEKI